MCEITNKLHPSAWQYGIKSAAQFSGIQENGKRLIDLLAGEALSLVLFPG